MEPVKLSETLIGREVERLFKLIPEPRHGCIRMNPVTGRDFVYGVDPIEPQKKKAYRALLAQELFAFNGPPDAPLLPINRRERRKCKWAGPPLDYLVAQYAASLDDQYDVNNHPSFADYVSGVLWEHESGAIGSRLPHSSEVIAELKRRFPPRQLEGLSCFCWSAAIPNAVSQAMALAESFYGPPEN